MPPSCSSQEAELVRNTEVSSPLKAGKSGRPTPKGRVQLSVSAGQASLQIRSPGVLAVTLLLTSHMAPGLTERQFWHLPNGNSNSPKLLEMV